MGGIRSLGGFARLNKFQKKRDNYGSGWVGPGLGKSKKIGKSSQNSPSTRMLGYDCVFCLFIYY